MPPLDDRDGFEWDEDEGDWLSEIPIRTFTNTTFTDMSLSSGISTSDVIQRVVERSRNRASSQPEFPPQVDPRSVHRYHPDRDERIAKHSPKSDGDRRTENVPLSALSL